MLSPSLRGVSTPRFDEVPFELCSRSLPMPRTAAVWAHIQLDAFLGYNYNIYMSFICTLLCLSTDVLWFLCVETQGFHRVTTREGGSANLNAVGSTSQSFLWTHEGASRGHPIVEVGGYWSQEALAIVTPHDIEKGIAKCRSMTKLKLVGDYAKTT